MALRAAQDHRRLADRRADEALLAGEGGGAALADDPDVGAHVPLAPGEVVVVADLVGRGGAEDLEHPVDDDVATGVGVVAGERHRRDVVLPERGVGVQQHRRRVHLARRARDR